MSAARAPGGGPLRELRQRQLSMSPDLTWWAVSSAPRYPSRSERNPAVVYWRHLRIDPGLAGAWPASAAAGTLLETGRTGTPGSWTVPLSRLLPGLSWHPARPLVAGLALRGRHAVPWIADCAARTVRVFDHVRAALSLTLADRPHPPLAWCGENGLVLLAAEDTGEPGDLAFDDPVPDAGPPAFEASGPGYVTFSPGFGELAALAGARLVLLDAARGTPAILSGPLLVGSIRPSPSGRRVLVEHATGADDTDPEERRLRWSFSLADGVPGAGPPVPLPAGQDVCWLSDEPLAVSQHRSQSQSVLRLSGPEHSWSVPLPGELASVRALAEIPAGPEPGRLVLGGTAGDGRLGIAVVNPREPAGHALTMAWAPEAGPATQVWAAGRGGDVHVVAVHDGQPRRYRLRDGELVPAAAHLPDLAPESPWPGLLRERLRLPAPFGHVSLTMLYHPAAPAGSPLLLWLRPGGGPDSGAGFPAWLTLPAAVTGLLALPMHWPPDAPAEGLCAQVVEAVERAARLAAENLGDRCNGSVIVGGHSFGATLALLALSRIPALSAAIVHSGCYNRTLTTAGFQYERRPYWAAPEVYHAFSPLLFADQLTRPVLIVHGAEDHNPPTPAEQAVDLYRGIVATGGHARLVLLPDEEHTYAYLESQQALVREHASWLSRFGQAPAVDERARQRR